MNAGRQPSSRGVSIVAIILATSLFIVCFDNNQFWQAIANSVSGSPHPLRISASMFLLLFCGINVTLALTIGIFYFRLMTALLLLVSAAIGFYMSQFGVAIDTSIIRSVLETDMREASTLLSIDLFWHIALFGCLPALVVLVVPLRRYSWKRELASRTALVCASIVIPASVLYFQYLELSFYAQENRHVRLFMNPLYPVYAVGQFVAETIRVQAETETILATGITRNVHWENSKPLAVVLVIGETARADHWSLNGYARETNPFTKNIGAVNFEHVTACGTSTADSLPCLFSPLSRTEFSHVEAARNESLLAILKRVDIDVTWLDNSTGCKELCDAEDFVSVAGASDAQFCDSYGCYDELLTKKLAEALTGNADDSFFVLHQRGSHGPTYYMNTPEAAKRFLPECRLDTFRDCDGASLQNAYDNTILYTDQFLAHVIEKLRQIEVTHDVALLYVSDHGESLGEGGLYLHGFPYSLAPDAQKHVPMLFWASERFYQRSGIDPACIEVTRNESYSHDSIFHTSLALMGVDADGYRQDLDIFAACRSASSVERFAMSGAPLENRVMTPDQAR